MFPLSWLSLDSRVAPWGMLSHADSLFSRMCLLGLAAREPGGKVRRSEEQSLLGAWSCSFPACNPPPASYSIGHFSFKWASEPNLKGLF